MSLVLAAKLVLVPALIAAITLAGRRFGPRVAGMLTGLPVVAGPIALVLALEQGPVFAARAATATLPAEASLAAFCVVYARVARRAPWWTSVVAGWLGFAAGTLALDRLDVGLTVGLATALATPLVMLALIPAAPAAARGATGPAEGGQMALRMLAGVALVLALTAIAHALGPRLSGLLTVFPIATTVLAVFAHRDGGAAFAGDLLRGFALGLYSLSAFFTTLALALEPWGVAAAFGAAAVAAIAAQAVVLAYQSQA